MLRSIGSCSGLALVIVVSAVMAQEQSQRRGAGVIFAPGNPAELLRSGPMREEVRKELAISDEQTKQMEEAFAPLKELDGDFREAQGLAPEERRKRMTEIATKRAAEGKLAEERLNQILKPEQRARWKQLWLQRQGNVVLLQPEIAKQLGLTDEQREKMREIAASLNPQPGQPKLQDLSQQERQQFFGELNARRDKALLDMLEVLTDEQKTRFAEMKGKEFPFPTQRLGSFSDQPGGQQPPRVRAGGRLRGGLQTFGNPIELLEYPVVQKELAISNEQMQQLEKAFVPLRELGGDANEARNLSPEEQRKLLQEIAEKGAAASKLVAEDVDQILNPEQRQRLKQLWLQFQGIRLITQPDVAKELGLTQEQQDKIRKVLKVVQDHRMKAANPPPGQPGFQEFSQAELEQWRSELRALEEKAEAETLAVLTDEQKAKFAEMNGKEFDFQIPAFRRRRPSLKQ